MALNFPRPDQSPFVDPESGLKYIFNPTIGAWETAIQPPVVVTYDNTAPDLNIEGFLWYNNSDHTLYIYRNNTWLPVVDGEYGPVFIGVTPPGYPNIGDLWWDPVSGNLFVWYVDPTSSQWMPATANSGSGLTTSGSAYVGAFAPAAPYEGQLWFNSSNNILYVYTDDTGWEANLSEISGVTSISASFPILVNEDSPNIPRISILPSTTSDFGVIKLSSSVETSLGASSSTAVTPAGLKYALTDSSSNFIPKASETQAGILEIATDQEVVAGLDTEKAITPANLQSALPSLGLSNPPGTIIMFAGDTAPSGYLECDGVQISRSDYQLLFAAIGVYHGVGDNSTTFNIPDLRGEFVRGWSGTKGTDPSRQLGSFQTDSVGAHTHTFPLSPTEGTDSNVSYGKGEIGSGMGIIEVTANSNSAETRPRNIALMYCIKT